jgi:hypothetical protein
MITIPAEKPKAAILLLVSSTKYSKSYSFPFPLLNLPNIFGASNCPLTLVRNYYCLIKKLLLSDYYLILIL